MENFFRFESFGGDVAALFDFQGAFASGGPAGSCAEENDARERRESLGDFVDLRFESKRLANQFRDAFDSACVDPDARSFLRSAMRRIMSARAASAVV